MGHQTPWKKNRYGTEQYCCAELCHAEQRSVISFSPAGGSQVAGRGSRVLMQILAWA